MDAARKVSITSEVIQSENGRHLDRPITRVAGLAVVQNVFAGQYSEDLAALFEIGRVAGEQMAERLASQFEYPVVSYSSRHLILLLRNKTRRCKSKNP